VAIVRPGPVTGKFVNPYIQRKLGRQPVTYLHPSFQPFLERTYGVPLYQEQVMKIGMVAANLTGGEAEELRKAMGGKRSEAILAGMTSRSTHIASHHENRATNQACDAKSIHGYCLAVDSMKVFLALFYLPNRTTSPVDRLREFCTFVVVLGNWV
jgi:hypothetical protein